MTDQEIFDELTGILRDLLGDPGIVLAKDTRRPDVPRWDSFGYVTFIVAVEQSFGIKFHLTDVESFETVGDIVEKIKELKGWGAAAVS